MAVPFRKVSKTRRDMRRTHYKVAANGLVKCPNCGKAKLSHRVCPNCGYYKGKQGMTIKSKDSKIVEA